MPNVKIKKAKIKDGLFLEVEFTEELQGHSKKDTKLSCTVPTHDDLRTAMQNLHKHMAVLCDEVQEPKRADFEAVDFSGFTVRGFSIGGNDEHEGVTINGYKDGKYGAVNLVTPFTKYSDEEYPFCSELSNDVDVVVNEVLEYLFEGKRQPEEQLTLIFEFQDEEDR